MNFIDNIDLFSVGRLHGYSCNHVTGLQSSGPEQAGCIGLLHAGEVGEHLHEVARVAAAQNLVAHVLTRSRIKSATLGKDVGNVHSQHLRPQIAIVSGGIAPTPHMVEVAGMIAGWNLLVQQAYLPQGLSLKFGSLVGSRHILRGQHVPGEIDACGSEVLAEGIGGLEVDALQHALLQISRHRLACLTMAGIVIEYLRNGCKRLVELRGHLYKVAGDACATQSVVLAIGEDAVQGVSELMKHGGHFVPCQQRGFTLGSLGAVAHIKYNR